MSTIITELVESSWELGQKLWPLNRSITGEGVRQTLAILGEEIPGLKILKFASGTKCFDWTIPKEWKVNDAYIIDPTGKKLCSFQNNNLHLVGYSDPYEGMVNLNELQDYLHSLPELPEDIPYITQYYSYGWGFCISQAQRDKLEPGTYKVFVDTEKIDGELNLGEVFLPGETEDEVLISTYICHPSMANNELSGPMVSLALIKLLSRLKKRRYSYRFIFAPETIGPIAYLSKNHEKLKKNVKAAFNLTCVGDNRSFSYMPSRNGNTLADKAALQMLNDTELQVIKYNWLDRGSDERQYCSPGIDLPMVSLMRTKYGEYPEYHSSADIFGDVVNHNGLAGGISINALCIISLELNFFPKIISPCEPQLGTRGLYPNTSTKETNAIVSNMMNIISYCDGDHDVYDISKKCDLTYFDTIAILIKVRSILTNEEIADHQVVSVWNEIYLFIKSNYS